MRTALFAAGCVAAGFAAGLAAFPGAAPIRAELARLAHPFAAPAITHIASCAPVAVEIYFDRGESMLSSATEATLDAVSERVRGCAITNVSLEAQPDSVADTEGRRVAGLRGAALLKGLSDRGVTPEAVVIAQAEIGEPASADPTPEHMRLSISPKTIPLRNGVEIQAPRALGPARDEI